MGAGSNPDPSNGWESVASEFIEQGRRSRIGEAVVTAWASQIPVSSRVLDLGCGPGGPRSEPLHVCRAVFAIDASPRLADAYRQRFPDARVACEAAESSSLFGETFDAVMAWGLLFLLSPDAQREVIRRVGAALTPGGRFLFTAPRQVVTWPDNSTGRPSVSLGLDAYRDLLHTAGLTLLDTHEDDGGNFYYETIRTGNEHL